jgi:transcriptional regulator with AAA-type ATPase domain
MAFRLVAVIEGRHHRFNLAPGEQILGSHPECAVRLAHSTVSRRHAKITVDSTGVAIEDLKSRNGIRLGSEKLSEARIPVGAEIRIGAVPVVLEEIPDQDLEAAVLLAGTADGDPSKISVADGTTFSSGPGERFIAEKLPGLLDRMAQGSDFETIAQSAGEALFDLLPCLKVTVTRGDDEDHGVLFHASRGEPSSSDGSVLSADAGDCVMRVTLLTAALVAGAEPLVEATGAVLRLATSRAPTAPTPAEPATPPPLPDPPSLASVVRRIYSDAARVARGDVGVLILGESGTGKEVLARYLHQASPRANGPFLGLDCAALPTDLLEAELFGIEKGVATGVDERPGKFELATDGTLFLDEIGDMALETQAKILRILQSGECYRLGSRQPHMVNVRVAAATNCDLRAMLADGLFRTDLYHRIATWVVDLPPLRHRRVDIANLAAFFLAREAGKRGLRVKGISRAAIDALEAFSWPGNIRQLENEMARAVLFLEDGELLDTGRLAEEIRGAGAETPPGSLRATLDRTERLEISAALDEKDGNIDATAERLGISRATLYRRMKALAIES